MGIASFSPLFARCNSPGLSTMWAPLQTLATFLVPARPASVGQRTITYPAAEHLANVQKVLQRRPVAALASGGAQPPRALKVIREFEPGLKRSQVGRMAICGRMADVCAELDRIALKASASP